MNIRFSIAAVLLGIALRAIFTSKYPKPDLADDLRGRVALITGASRGLGKGYALGFAEKGATLYLTATTIANAEKTCVEARELGAEYCMAIACNNENDDEIAELYRIIEEDQAKKSPNGGRLDIVVNNAFNTGETHKYAGRKFWAEDKGDYPGHVYDIFTKVGLRSHYVSTVHAMRLMTKTAPTGESDRGLVVFTSSGGGMNYFVDVAYGVGKAAVDRMAADMAIESASENVTVVSTWPGWVDTDQVRWEIAQGENGTFGKLKNGAGTTDESAKFYLFDTVGTPIQETILFNGRALAALAMDKGKAKFSGKVLPTYLLSKYYSVFDEKNWRTPGSFTLRWLALMIFKGLREESSLPFVMKWIPDVPLFPTWLSKLLWGPPHFM
jgi:NAD(P)-dependent dehydrogenase (short-subunit alcohol dehydrogenase family)